MGRKSDARERLMAACHKLIWEYSYGSVTIEAICKRALVKKGSFYYFFDSKSDLAVAAIDAWWLQRRARMEEIFQPEVPPLERIRKYLNLVVGVQLEAYEANGQILGCPLFTLGAEICTQDERIKLRIQGILAAVLDFFEGAIRDAQALGEIEGTNAALKSRLLFSCYEGVLTMARLENNPELIRSLGSDVMASLGPRGNSSPKLVAA